MAASTRALTPTHSGPFSTTSVISNALSPIPPSGPISASLNPQAAATSTLRASISPKSPRVSPQPTVAKDNFRLREQIQDSTRDMSPNHAAQAQEALAVGAEAAANRIRDPPPAATAQMINPPEKVTKSIIIPENVTTDNIQTSPVSLSSFSSVDPSVPAATAIEPATAGPLAIDNVPGQDRTTPQPLGTPPHPNTIDGTSNRAFTFPGPLVADGDPRGPQRGMSLPGYGQSPKSPNAKRHKCPYCATDFTRHHNLKSHLLTHSQEKPYECPDCHARFRRLHDLKRHTKLHTGERPHICPKCGRRFARGDALARHNKGQGGCAGRRSSFAGDDDMDGDDSRMDGLEYHGGEGDDSRMNEDDIDSARRVSEPARRGTASRQSSLQANYHAHGSTYPPVVAATHGLGNSMRTIYPQGGPGAMTESPKPLSPGQPEHHKLNEGGSIQGGRSPSLSQHVLPQQFGRIAKLPPPPGSLSSHGGSSGGSLREIAGVDRNSTEVWSVLRDLEARTLRQNEQYEARIQQLEREVTALKSQLGQRHHASPQPAPPPPAQQQQAQQPARQ